MTIQEMQASALEIASKYRQNNKAEGQKEWDTSAFMAGFVGDVGDLSKLIMAKSNLRRIDDIDAKITHELSDCFWSILVLADQLGVDIESSFKDTMKELEARL